MGSSVVKCGVIRKDGLSPTINKQGRIICTNCGQEVNDQLNKQLDTQHHIFYEFIGAYCPLHQSIHYRWVNKNWKMTNDPILRKTSMDDPIILPRKTDYNLEKKFLKKYFWMTEHGCQAPGYKEVIWNDFENSKQVLLRPSDTGFQKINRQGIHAPFIAAILEWLIRRDEWTRIAEIAEHSLISNREKKIVKKTVVNATPSNIFKLLWTFRRYIPDWNNKRSLGRRSPSSLIIDEIRWATHRIDDLDKKDRDRLIKYGPEPQYWGSWYELWPKNISLNGSLKDYGEYLAYLGIRYGNELTLINETSRSDERSWIEIADNLVNWSIIYNMGGKIDLSHSIREEHGFVDNLIDNLSVSVHNGINNKSKWENHLRTNLPLCWMYTENKRKLNFEVSVDNLYPEELQKTLRVLKPWIDNKTNCEVYLTINGKIDDDLRYRVDSFENRLTGTSIDIIKRN